uniref:Ig-like domain-containing protein n=1 Tax=Electrophorus electricus TaxID=8005 RepID=A0A4W4DWZ8_ELEEL
EDPPPLHPLPDLRKTLLTCLTCISVIEESTSQVTANSGGGVRIKCKYEEGYETNKKYFCKDEETTCSYQIITEAKHTWVHEDRFSLYDDTNAKVFWVVMRNLTVKDSGTYQCGVDITDKAKEDMHTPVKLKVKIYLRVTGEQSLAFVQFITSGVYPVTPLVQLSTWSAHHSPSPAPSIQPEHRDSPPGETPLSLHTPLSYTNIIRLHHMVLQLSLSLSLCVCVCVCVHISLYSISWSGHVFLYCCQSSVGYSWCDYSNLLQNKEKR